MMTVFITRSTNAYHIRVWDAKIGITKEAGCVMFWSGRQFTGGSIFDGAVGGPLREEECRRQYGDFPDEGEAWLVTPIKEGELKWRWTHVDPDMALLDCHGKKLTTGRKVMRCG